jgi:hypothetical protein
MSRLFNFVAGAVGPWRVEQAHCIAGAPLATAPRLAVQAAPLLEAAPGAVWCLRGITSNERYVERSEKKQLLAVQQGLGRREKTCAALIPIRKNAAWWALTQDERRDVFETRSRHTQIGMKSLPQVSRRLHHCRDLSETEPFDFLTWFEFAPAHRQAFDDMLAELRASEEWRYIDREVDLRLTLD